MLSKEGEDGAKSVGRDSKTWEENKDRFAVIETFISRTKIVFESYILDMLCPTVWTTTYPL